MKNKFKDFDKTLIIKDYQNKVSLKDLKKKYNISVAMIYKILDKFEIPRKGNCRKYFFKETYFDIIDTEEKAYFLGFLYADGNNYSPTGCIQLKIQENDVEILNRFSTILSNNEKLPIRRVKRKEGKDQVCLKLSSKYMSSILYNKGLIDAKSLILTFPDTSIVPEELQSHFIRGYFDGDGCINIYKTTGNFTITGTKEFLITLQDILIKELKLNKTKFTITKNINNLVYGGNRQIVKIREWLYKDATIYLERKYKKFQDIKQIRKFRELIKD